MEFIKDCISKSWGVNSGVFTLKHDDYLCPFCSHGETIEIHVFAKEADYSRGFDFTYKLSCLGSCMSYDLITFRGTSIDKIDASVVLEKAKNAFSNLITFSKNFTCYKKNIDFIMV